MYLILMWGSGSSLSGLSITLKVFVPKFYILSFESPYIGTLGPGHIQFGRMDSQRKASREMPAWRNPNPQPLGL